MNDQHQMASSEDSVTQSEAHDSQRPPKRSKQRLDLLLVARGLAESREQARRLIMAGEVLVDEQVSDKPGRTLPVDAVVRVRNRLPYVSRGGQKLAAALDAFALDVSGKVAVDVGASTGGFTDCLLQHGAKQVFAIDVGYGQLAWKLRTDARVVALERTNIRHLTQLPDGIRADLAVIDASFISLGLVLPPTLNLLQPHGDVVALIKPQFEAGQADVGKGGVVRDAKVHGRVLQETLDLAARLGCSVAGLIASPLLGPAGNVEFLVWLRRGGDQASTTTSHAESHPESDTERATEPLTGPNTEALIAAALEQARTLRQTRQ